MKKYRPIILLFLLLGYISYLLVSRVIIVRLPRDVGPFLYSSAIFITAIIILYLLVRTYLLLKTTNIIKSTEIKNLKLRQLKNKFLLLIQKIKDIFSEPFQFITKKSIKYNQVLFSFANLIYDHIPSKGFTLTILFLDVFLKVIVLLTFLIDVFYFKQLNYIYKLGVLILLPRLFELLIIALEEYSKEQTKNLICSYLDSKHIEGTEYHELCFIEGVDTTKFQSDFDEFFYMLFLPIFSIQEHVFERKAVHAYYKVNWIKLIICILYIVAWINIFLKGLAIF